MTQAGQAVPGAVVLVDPADERAVRDGVGVLSWPGRGLVEVNGRDRQAWLHNVITCAVKAIPVGRGAYSFACDVRGRIQFDLSVLAFDDRLWLDVPLERLAAALAHLNRFLISEDVTLTDITASQRVIRVVGPRAAAIAMDLGAADLNAMPDMAHTWVVPGGMADSDRALLVCRRIGATNAFDLLVPAERFTPMWERVLACGPRVVGDAAVLLLKIEAGIPTWGSELTEASLPAETGQLERAVSFKKGCYLGQEVIERMRAHGSLAKRLVRVEVEEGADILIPTPIVQVADAASASLGLTSSTASPDSPAEVGRITSLLSRPSDGRYVGLGFLRRGVSDDGRLRTGDPPRLVRSI